MTMKDAQNIVVLALQSWISDLVVSEKTYIYNHMAHIVWYWYMIT